MAVHTAKYKVEWKPAGSWVDISAYVTKVEGAAELSGQRDNALAFGDDSDLRCTVFLNPRLATPTLSLSTWELIPIRYTTQVDADIAEAFTGVITDMDGDRVSRRLSCEGAKKLVTTSKAKMYSPAYDRRPVATATTVTSVEDPTSPSYRAGLINWILWQAGGRPAAQDFAYPNASFYYHCDQAILSPDWLFIGGGDDGWQEALKLARASGGQLFQAADGIVYYRQPLAFGSGTAAYTFAGDIGAATDSLGVYADARFTGATSQLVTKLICPVLPRSERALQPIADDTTLRSVGAGETIEFTIDPQLPVTGIEGTDPSSLIRAETVGGQLKSDAIVANFSSDGAIVPQGGSGYTHTISVLALRITITITNETTRPFLIWRVTLNGTPIARGEPTSVTVGDGEVERPLEESVYVQTREHAERLARLTLAFYNQVRPTRTILGCAHDPRRVVGETVNLTVPEWDVTDEPHVIVAIRHSNTGLLSEYDLVSVAGLPVDDEYYEFGPDYSGQTRKLGY